MRVRSIIKAAALVVATAALVGLGVLYYQGRQPPRANSAYVALGSSFAAGLGLGEQEPGSPLVCQRSINGYPQLLARLAGLELTDVSCSAATVEHVFHGGQMFLGPQINALGPDTRLVTITAGGNDIGYVGDLTAMAYVRKGGIIGFVVDVFWQGAEPIAERDFAGLEADLTAGLLEIRRRAPDARIVVLTYPAILPETGTCAQLGIDAGEAELMHEVASELAEVTRLAATEAGAEIVDLAATSLGHNACSAEPWINGSAPAVGAPFHPTPEGARGVANQLAMHLHAGPENIGQERQHEPTRQQ